MRSWKMFMCTAIALAVVGCVGPQEDYGPQVSGKWSSLGSPASTFRDVLAPYGEWINSPTVGWVWRPHAAVVGTGFMPYATGGHWAYGDRGWVFETGWAWDWAPFHFGRWFNEPRYGWVWWPDDEWAPSWVDWRWGGGFVGWQPLAPPGVAVDPAWNFVPAADFARPDVDRYRVPPGRTPDLLRDTQAAGERITARTGQWSRGPEPSDIESATGQPLPRAKPSAPPTGHPALPAPDTTR